MGLMNERAALGVAIHDLRNVKARLDAILRDLYDSAPGWAGEVESIKEATDNAIRVFEGGSPE